MPMSFFIPPDAEEREIKFLGSASIDGTPIAYTIVMAAVVAALTFIPISFQLGSSGGGIPLSDGVLPLVGWLLGPVAGIVASGIGMSLGVVFAPYNAGPIPILTIVSAMLASFAAGVMGRHLKRGWWWLLVGIFGVLCWIVLCDRALNVNEVSLNVLVAGTFIDWSAWLLLVLPTRYLFIRLLKSERLPLVAIGIFMGTWCAAGISHLMKMAVSYFIYNWPLEVWITLIPLIPFEHMIRCVAATVIGVGVISGLRVLFIVKPPEAMY